MRALRGSNVTAVLAKLVPITRGWAAYYRTVVASKVFRSLDHYVWKLLYKWAKHSHGNKPGSWIVDRYFGKFNKFRNDRWVFGDRDSGAYLPRLSWTPIVRHTMVKGGASPDDPSLAGYWATRRRKIAPPLDTYTLRLLTRQDALSTVRGPPAHRRTATPIPGAVGTMVAAGHPAGDSRQLPPAPWGTRLTGWGPNPPCPRLLPPRAPRPPSQQPSTANQNRPRGLLEPCAAMSGTSGSEHPMGAKSRTS